MMQRRGDWIQTFTGRPFWPLDPRPEDVAIEDIAHPLSNICRFTGHCRWFYSVAQHSIIMAELVGLPGLLHDGSEAYATDVPRPIKRLPEMWPYREAEAVLQGVIFERFGVSLTAQEEERLKIADEWLLSIEAEVLMGPLLPGWNFATAARLQHFGPFDRKYIAESVKCEMSPRYAKERFLSEAADLLREHTAKGVR